MRYYEGSLFSFRHVACNMLGHRLGGCGAPSVRLCKYALVDGFDIKSAGALIRLHHTTS